MDKTFLDLYKSYYPDSVVSSICAVNIENISKYSEGQEVLLRGAFFQVLRFYESEERIIRENVTVNNKNITLNGKNITVKLTQM